MRIQLFTGILQINVIAGSIILFCFSILLIPRFAGCSKPADAGNQNSTEYFPNKVGNSWEYEVIDSSDLREHGDIPVVYSVIVAITGTEQLLNGQMATIWMYDFPYGREVRFVVSNGDTIKVYDSLKVKDRRSLLFPNQMFLIPFYNNASWAGKLEFSDAYEVIQKSPISSSFF